MCYTLAHPMSEERFTVIATRASVTSVMADSIARGLAWGLARTYRDQGMMVWIVTPDFASVVVAPDQSLDE